MNYRLLNRIKGLLLDIVVGHFFVLLSKFFCLFDIVVGDGDGVVVVPRAVAEQGAKYVDEILTKDKAGWRSLYESLGRPLDKTVK